MADTIVAELVGGPADGRILALPDLPDLRQFYRIPVAQPVEFIREPELGADPSMSCAEYELALDPAMRRPSRNDAGAYRYEFKGMRRG